MGEGKGVWVSQDGGNCNKGRYWVGWGVAGDRGLGGGAELKTVLRCSCSMNQAWFPFIQEEDRRIPEELEAPAECYNMVASS